MMRNSIYMFLLVLITASCKEVQEESSIKDYAEVNLYFKDFQPTEHKSFLDLKIENGISPIQQQLKISDSGRVSYHFINNKKRELVFNYEGREFSLILSPGEQLQADLSIETLVKQNSKLKGFKIVSGKNMKTNNLILANYVFLDSLISEAPHGFTNDGQTEDNAYRNIRIDDMNKQIAQFELFITENKIDDRSFINWAKAQIRYRAGNDLSLYPFTAGMNRTLSDTDDYFSFINQVNPNHNDELVYQSYLEYLETLATSFKIMSNISNTYQSQRQQLKRESTSNFPIAFNMIKKRPKNNEQSYLMAYAFKKNSLVPETYSDSLKYFVSDNLLAQVQSFEERESKNIISLIENYDISENDKRDLLSLYKNAKGKVIYHDFWFTNCAPCMRELPNYNDLIATTNSNEVEYIFYGVYMDEVEWKETIDAFQLKGKHHLLTKNQLAFFEKYFGLHSFPHHQIVNSNGIIGEKIDLRTVPDNFEEITKLISNHQISETTGL